MNRGDAESELVGQGVVIAYKKEVQREKEQQKDEHDTSFGLVRFYGLSGLWEQE